jgi:hypothetical protein
VRTELGEVLRGDDVLVVLVVVTDGEERRVELLQLHHVLVPNAVQRRPLDAAAAALLLARGSFPTPRAHPASPPSEGSLGGPLLSLLGFSFAREVSERRAARPRRRVACGPTDVVGLRSNPSALPGVCCLTRRANRQLNAYYLRYFFLSPTVQPQIKRN